MPETHEDTKDKPLILKEKHQIRSYDVDVRKKATLMSLCRCFQESAGHHSQTVKLSYEHLLEMGQFWALSRFYIEVDRYPLWQEEISIETWSKGPDGIFALRDFIFYDVDDKVITRGTSGWLALDIKRRRPVRLDYFADIMPYASDKHAVDYRFSKISAIEKPDIKSTFTVGYYDLDISNHVTSIKYVEWILSSFPFEYLSDKQVRSFEINFMAESLYDDELMVIWDKTSQSGKITPVTVKRKADDRELCRARVGWD
jgi:acyl-ACP thioesterase